MADTHFGFETVSEEEKAKRVAGVFTSVAGKYDVMNDLMSAGLHRVWKRFAVNISGVRTGQHVLDVAGGSADLSRLFLKKHCFMRTKICQMRLIPNSGCVGVISKSLSLKSVV